MGWGWLKPVAKIGAAVAAPFTGGASLGAIPAIDAIGGAASAIAGGRASGRQAEAQTQDQHDVLALQAAKLNLEAPGMRLGQSARGDLAAGLQPVSFSGSGRDLRMNGGISPSLLSQNTRQLGQQVSRDALLGQMKGPAFTPTPLPQANALDTILQGAGYAGLIGQGINAVRGARKPKPTGPPLSGPLSANVRGPRF